MTSLALRALDGRTPLGFLAALGTLRLIAEHTAHTPRLAWSPRDCTAVLHDGPPDMDVLVADLTAVMRSISANAVLPGLAEDFPPPGAAPDKLRLTRRAFRDYATQAVSVDGPAVERWLGLLVTDLALDNEQRVAITPYAAPSGKQSMRTMLEKPLGDLRKQPVLLREAFTGWRRYSGVTGEYLDHRVLYDTADTPDGKPGGQRGVPGATWLALMSYPLFTSTAPTGQALSTCWQDRGKAGRRMVYPLWSHPLNIPAVQALLDHPVLVGGDDHRPSPQAQLLSIFWIGHAARRLLPAGKSAGVLTPLTLRSAT
jgi:hypothetical protein